MKHASPTVLLRIPTLQHRSHPSFHITPLNAMSVATSASSLTSSASGLHPSPAFHLASVTSNAAGATTLPPGLWSTEDTSQNGVITAGGDPTRTTDLDPDSGGGSEGKRRRTRTHLITKCPPSARPGPEHSATLAGPSSSHGGGPVKGKGWVTITSTMYDPKVCTPLPSTGAARRLAPGPELVAAAVLAGFGVPFG